MYNMLCWNIFLFLIHMYMYVHVICACTCTLQYWLYIIISAMYTFIHWHYYWYYYMYIISAMYTFIHWYYYWYYYMYIISVPLSIGLCHRSHCTLIWRTCKWRWFGSRTSYQGHLMNGPKRGKEREGFLDFPPKKTTCRPTFTCT